MEFVRSRVVASGSRPWDACRFESPMGEAIFSWIFIQCKRKMPIQNREESVKIRIVADSGYRLRDLLY